MVVMDPDQWHILVKFHMGAYDKHFQEEEENEKEVEKEERKDAIKKWGKPLGFRPEQLSVQPLWLRQRSG